MTQSLKDDRLELRLTSEQKRRIEQAAALAGQTVTEFSVPTLVDRAEEIIRDEHEFSVSMEGWNVFRAALRETTEPPAGLLELFQRPSAFGE